VRTKCLIEVFGCKACQRHALKLRQLKISNNYHMSSASCYELLDHLQSNAFDKCPPGNFSSFGSSCFVTKWEILKRTPP